MLRRHLKRYGTMPDGRIFRTVRRGLIQNSADSAVLADARAASLTPTQQASPLVRWAPTDLRHAGVSLALNASVTGQNEERPVLADVSGLTRAAESSVHPRVSIGGSG